MSAWLNNCRFNPTAGGTTDWTYSSAVTGYQSPSAAGVVNGRTYTYRAESADQTQWEIGRGTYNTGTGVLARTTVMFNSSGTTAKINFTATPTVAFVALKEDLLSIEEDNVFTAAQKTQARKNLAVPFRGSLGGLILSTAGSSSTFSVSVGEAADSTAADLLVLASAYSKTTALWNVGSGNGGLDTGSISASTWYHVYLIKRLDTGVVDVCISLSATSPNLTSGNIPNNYTLFRRIGSMKTNGSSQWTKFVQVGDQFLWDVAVTDYAAGGSLGTSAATVTLTVPTGVKVVGLIRSYLSGPVGTVVLISSFDESDQAPSGSNFNVGGMQTVNQVAGMQLHVLTNTSAGVRIRSNTASTTAGISTFGWLDARGRYD